MFMRAVLSEEARVGLLLLDEPSAALDPTAEHGVSRSIALTSLGIDDRPSNRFVHAHSKAEGRENDDLLIPSVRTTY